MNSQTGRWLDVRAADLRAAGAIWWRERRSCGRAFGARLISDGDQKRLRQIAHDVVLPCVWKKSAVDARVAGCIIAWRKRAQKVPAAQKWRDPFRTRLMSDVVPSACAMVVIERSGAANVVRIVLSDSRQRARAILDSVWSREMCDSILALEKLRCRSPSGCGRRDAPALPEAKSAHSGTERHQISPN